MIRVRTEDALNLDDEYWTEQKKMWVHLSKTYRGKEAAGSVSFEEEMIMSASDDIAMLIDALRATQKALARKRGWARAWKQKAKSQRQEKGETR